VVFYRLQSRPAAPSRHRNLAHAAEGAHDHQALPSDPALRVKSLKSLLVDIDPRNGARLGFKARTVSGRKPKMDNSNLCQLDTLSCRLTLPSK
jgi:hypothetical protein